MLFLLYWMDVVVISEVQGLATPPRVRGWGQEGKGRGQNFLTLTQTLTLIKGWGLCEGKSRVVNK